MNQDSAALIRAIKGPILMITVGALFALDNFTPFGFSRTWPVLVIVVGILSLGAKAGKWEARGSCRAQWGPAPRPQAARPAPPPQPRANPTAEPGSYRGSSYQAGPLKTPTGGAEPVSQVDPGATQ